MVGLFILGVVLFIAVFLLAYKAYCIATAQREESVVENKPDKKTNKKVNDVFKGSGGFHNM